MNKDWVKNNPYLCLFGDMCDFGIRLSDLKLIQKKIEEIEFSDTTNYGGEETLITYSFPDIPRNGFIVTLMIFAESEFRNIVKILDILEKYPIGWNDVRGNAFEKLLLFTKKFSKLQIKGNKKSEDRIRSLIETRNCIVHANSIVIDYPKKNIVSDFIKTLAGCKIDNGSISFSFEGTLECAELIEKYITFVYQAALLKYPNEK
jgi:hypothetical protein